MWKISSYIVSLILLVPLWSHGQFGNEWIDFNQSYYKIKIVDDDFYRITAEELEAVGFPVSTVSSKRIQLYRQGEEVAINTVPQDGILEYLEFYGRRNDGTGDSQLYDIGTQPHTFYNLFSDTATYFLTYKLGNENGKRMSFSSDQNATGLSAEPFHLAEDLLVYSSKYAPGIRFGSGSSFTLSKYDEGEGWTGFFFTKGGFTNHDFILQNLVPGQNIICDYVLIGGNSLAHNANISVGPNSTSLNSLKSTEFQGWGSMLDSFTFPTSNVGPSGELTIQILREGFPEAADRFSVSYLRIRYAQNLEMTPNENKIFTLTNPNTPKAFLQIGTTNAAGTSIFDITDPFDPIRMATSSFSDRIEVVVPNSVNNHQLLAVTNPATVARVEAVQLVEPSVLNKDYLIITHPSLRSSGDPVNDYKSYRESAAGGNYNVDISQVDELYDLFNYGDPSPMAIRKYIQYAASESTIQYVFIIGKGYTFILNPPSIPDDNFFREPDSPLNIPTYGMPGSDLMYTLGINTAPDLPGIPIGRLNAFTPADVTAYLNKVVEMEALPFNALWRKDFLQLSGGFNPGEPETFAGYIKNFGEVIEQDFIGGRAFNTGKETSASVEYIDVTDRVNQGVGYITFFGHSSGTVTDIEIGRVSEPDFGFVNTTKYPIFLVNGCKAGEIFGNNFTFGEDWMITPDLGAVGFIAHADFATATSLRRWSDLFYDLSFANDTYIGESVGNVLIEVSSRYLSQYGSSNSSLTQVQQMIYEGDPAYRVFGADSPDYFIDDLSLFAEPLEGTEVLASQDSFKLNLIVKNFGRSVADSVLVQVDRILPDGSTAVFVEKFLRPLRLDTLVFFIPNDPTQDNTGQNIFNVQIDPENSTAELNESNNTATLEISIFNGNTTHLFPINNGTVSGQQVELVWQSSNLLEDDRSYDLEIDIEPNFESPNRRLLSVSGELLMTNVFDFSSFSLPDSSTIYWRTRFADPAQDEDNTWVTTSFTIINNIPNGWGQYESDQINNAGVTGVEYNQSTGQWEFVQTITPIDIFTFGIDNPNFQYEDIEAIVGGIDFMVTSNTIDPFCKQNTFNAIAFDKESGDPYRPIDVLLIDVFNDEICGRIPQRIYNFEENDILVDGRLQVLVDNMRDGDQIVLFNIGDVSYSNWDASVTATLNSVGVSTTTINNLIDGQPVIFFGRKGDAPGTAIEVINNGTPESITEQSIELQNNAVGSFSSGIIRSERIGPAKDWQEYSFNLSEEINDNYTLSVFGIDVNGVATSFSQFERGRAETIDVSSIDATIYPELELEFDFSDDVDLTPPQLNFWEVNYSQPPEGILLSESKTVTTFQEGEEITLNIGFHNFSTIDFADSLDAAIRLINLGTGNIQSDTIKIAPPLAGDTTEFALNFSSLGYEGKNSLVISVEPYENEMYGFNNRLTLANLIEVEADETNPVIDVTFDGNHILDGDIVSPTPTISVRMRDNNQFLFKNDTLGINMSLKYPGDENSFQRINFSDPTLSYTSASETQDFEINYKPGQLSDGVYGLRVQAEDESGNDSGTEPYEVTFEVINASTITHFYPYPNPFSTSCRFVFTLTGSVIPDQIKIQILTVSGRVVREILQSEIGPIQIGNNITEYAWDGRDEFGDQLANGVYFYKVFVNSSGEQLDQRSTVADGAFKNGFGKLYILR